jgi:hypothetical protein
MQPEGTFADAAAWLRDQACTYHPDSEFVAQVRELSSNFGDDLEDQAAAWA